MSSGDVLGRTSFGGASVPRLFVSDPNSPGVQCINASDHRSISSAFALARNQRFEVCKAKAAFRLSDDDHAPYDLWLVHWGRIRPLPISAGSPEPGAAPAGAIAGTKRL
jgi:hypothetical protein